MGHSGGIDAGMAAACRLGGRYQLKNQTAIADYFSVCAQEMFGARFDWQSSVREQRPMLRSRL